MAQGSRSPDAPAPPREPRVVLVMPAGRDKAEYLKLREASWAWLEPWEPSHPGRDPFGDEAFDRFYKSSDTDTGRRFLIKLVEKRKPGAILGQVSINNIVRGAFQSATLGYWIGAEFAGKGYMTEALALAVEHAFEVLKLHRVEANIIPQNAPSIGLVRKLGFRYEGTAARYLKIAGHWQDHERWALTVEDRPACSSTRQPITRRRMDT